MKKSRKTFLLETGGEDSDFCGIKLLANGYTEHEHSIVTLQQKLGISPYMSVRDTQSSKTPSEFYFGERDNASLLIIGDMTISVEQIFQNEHPELQLSEGEVLTSAWDSESFAIFTIDANIQYLLYALHCAIMDRNVFIYRSTQEDLIGGPLIVGIHSIMRTAAEMII